MNKQHTKTYILKFGGAASQTPQDFDRLAQIIINRKNKGEQLAVVVSAMYNATNTLLKLAHEVYSSPCKRELDMLISTGERVSACLLCMALQKHGVNAKSFTGSQAGIITSSDAGEAQIIDVRPKRIHEAWQQDFIPVIAGFQGVSQEKDITTLGRGGSDISAVALGVYLQADAVAFYKEVPAIYDKDPTNEPQAKKLPFLSYTQALKIITPPRWALHPRSILLAEKHHIPLHFGSFKKESCYPGTIISSQ